MVSQKVHNQENLECVEKCSIFFIALIQIALIISSLHASLISAAGPPACGVSALCIFPLCLLPPGHLAMGSGARPLLRPQGLLVASLVFLPVLPGCRRHLSSVHVSCIFDPQ